MRKVANLKKNQNIFAFGGLSADFGKSGEASQT
jgi:hypothetical protein